MDNPDDKTRILAALKRAGAADDWIRWEPSEWLGSADSAEVKRRQRCLTALAAAGIVEVDGTGRQTRVKLAGPEARAAADPRREADSDLLAAQTEALRLANAKTAGTLIDRGQVHRLTDGILHAIDREIDGQGHAMVQRIHWLWADGRYPEVKAAFAAHITQLRQRIERLIGEVL